LNRDQKAAVIEEVTTQLREAEAVYAVDYRGTSVPQAAELRTKLRDADATFRIVKNTLTERAADKAEIAELKELLDGPTALTFVRGDAALAAKALRDQGRATETLAFKGGFMNGAALTPDDINSIARLPAREVLYGQLVGVVASPITGLARGLNGLLSGLAVALGGVLEKKESGDIPSGSSAPVAETGGSDAEAAPATDDDTTDQDAEAPEPATSTEDPAEGPDTTEETQEG